MIRSHEKWIPSLPLTRLTRWLPFFFLLGAAALFQVCPAFSGERVEAGTKPETEPILDRFLGEELNYRLGFWLFSYCGEVKAFMTATEQPGVYKASLDGRTVGFVDWLLGGYRLSYTSYLRVSTSGERFEPLRFELTVNHTGKERRRTVVFDHSKKQMVFFRSPPEGEDQQEVKPMEAGIIYEDYLTLFYNFRYGSYGPIQRDRTYRLPLYVHEGKNFLDVTVASKEEEEKRLEQEITKEGKDFFLRFRVSGEDVSSTSGEIEGWLSRDRVPTKGTIRDVVFFGDLWGELTDRRVKAISSNQNHGKNHPRALLSHWLGLGSEPY